MSSINESATSLATSSRRPRRCDRPPVTRELAMLWRAANRALTSPNTHPADAATRSVALITRQSSATSSVVIRQRTKQHTVRDRADRCRRADPQCECQQARRGKSRVPAKPAPRQLDVGECLAHPGAPRASSHIAAANVPARRRDRRDVAECLLRCPPRRIRREPASRELLGPKRDVQLDLIVHVAVPTRRSTKQAEAARHRQDPDSASARVTAEEYWDHRSASARRWARPVRVSV